MDGYGWGAYHGNQARNLRAWFAANPHVVRFTNKFGNHTRHHTTMVSAFRTALEEQANRATNITYIFSTKEV